jgi:hypothetical protein
MTMSDLAQSAYVQIVYVSRSTFTTMPPERGIEPSVARILAQSRTNNAKRGLVGALYFGDGCFFQCLEGRVEDVDRLYATLLKDPRHTDLKVLTRRGIPRKNFSNWAMKYVPLDAEMKSLLRELGMSSFDPYRFDDAIVGRVLDMLARGGDVAPATGGEADKASSGGNARTLGIAAAAGALIIAAIVGAVMLDLI